MLQYRVFKNGRSGNYYILYRDPHNIKKRNQLSLKTNNRKLADQLAPKLYEKIVSAEAEKTAPRSLAEFAAQYLESRGQSLTSSTQRAYRDSFTQFQKRIGNRELSTITARECELFISTKQKSAHTAAKHYRTLRTAFDKAVIWKLIKENPFRTFTKPPIPQTEADYFSEQDFRVFLSSLQGGTYTERRIRHFVVLAYETGLRLGELRNLKITAVDSSLSRLVVQNTPTFRTKSGRQRIVPLSPNALAAIRAQLRDNHENGTDKERESVYLFPSETGGVLSESFLEKQFLPRLRSALPDRPRLHFHSLRHGFGTRLALAGVPAQQIQKAMGHANVMTTERYTHLRELDLSGVQSVLSNATPYETPQEGKLIVLSTATTETVSMPQTSISEKNHKHIRRRKAG
jgi:integrase/recombinase XerD